MLRFVRIDHDDEEDGDMWFSFYCTVMDNFVWFNNNQIFRSKEHFLDSYNKKKDYEENRDLVRFLALLPDTLTTSNSEYKQSCGTCLFLDTGKPGHLVACTNYSHFKLKDA